MQYCTKLQTYWKNIIEQERIGVNDNIVITFINKLIDNHDAI